METMKALPMAGNVMKRIKSKKFSSVKTRTTDDACAICLENFKNTDKVSELDCDDKHVFHSNCLHNWLQTKAICPLCKKPVTNATQKN